MTTAIYSRMNRADYTGIHGVSITRLKEIKRSPQHYRYSMTHPRESDAMTLGIATHTATLEPERFAAEFAVWERTTSNGNMSPRNGQHWDAFCDMHAGKKILTPKEVGTAQAIALAVRTDATAMKYLAEGDPEVSMLWELNGRQCRGRVDWLTRIDGNPWVVGLKTARDCRHFAFGSQAAKLGYDMQWAFYHDGFEAITGTPPGMVEIVVESTPPYAVATYIINEDIVLQGRDNYKELLKTLTECELNNRWPGPVVGEQVLTLPSWFYPQTDDITDLGLEMTP